MTKHLHERGIALIIFFLILAYLPIIAADNASAQSCSGSWTITDTSWAKTNYQIGETISGSISFEISNLADCPRCTQQILIALIDSQNYIVDWKCIYDDIPQVCPPYETTGKVDITLRNPNYLGTYRIVATNEKQSSCSDAFLYGDYYPKMTTGQQMYLATITVAASNSINEPTIPTSPPPPTPTKEDATTGSSGSGTPQNGEAYKTGVSMQLITVIVGLLVLLFIFFLIGRKRRKGFIKFIIPLAVISFLGYLFWTYGIPVITKWFEENMRTIIGILLSLGALTIVGIAVWKNRNRIWEILKIPDNMTTSKDNEPEIPDNTTISKDDEPDINQLCDNIKKRINGITIPRRHKTEPPYQDQLFQWLISEFPNTKWEKQEEGRRPDLVINDIIAIEVKGPTTNDSLKDLITKTIYLKKYRRLICVLFEHDYDESQYQDITLFLRSKFGKKIDFIQKDSGSW